MDQIQNLKVEVSFQTNEAIRVKILDADEERFEVPVPIEPQGERISFFSVVVYIQNCTLNL